MKTSSEENKNSNKTHKRVTLEIALGVLEGMSIQLQALTGSVRWWAEGLAQQICAEHRLRVAFRNQIVKKIHMIPLKNAKDANNLDTQISMKERKEYLHYLRVTSQLMDFQCYAIKKRIEEIDTDLKIRYDKYIDDKTN